MYSLEMEVLEDVVTSQGDRKDQLTDRLKKREDEQLAKSELKKFQKIEKFADNEQISYFGAEFQRMKLDITTRLSQCKELSSDKTTFTEHLDDIAQRMQALKKFVADSQLFLTTYDKRVANETLVALQKSFSEKQHELLPKKKFTFKVRRKENESKVCTKMSFDETDKAAPVRVPDPSADCGFVEKDSEELVLLANAVNGKDVGLHRLKNCTIKIYGNPSTVHASDLRDCTVHIGPISTSVFVDDCIKVSFVVACQQLRIHKSDDCKFYVHVSSRSIIEDSRNLKFAPYNWCYDELDKHFCLAGLDRSVNNWKAVDDFNWLAADVPSPNWSVLEELENG